MIFAINGRLDIGLKLLKSDASRFDSISVMRTWIF